MLLDIRMKNKSYYQSLVQYEMYEGKPIHRFHVVMTTDLNGLDIINEFEIQGNFGDIGNFLSFANRYKFNVYYHSQIEWKMERIIDDVWEELPSICIDEPNVLIAPLYIKSFNPENLCNKKLIQVIESFTKRCHCYGKLTKSQKFCVSF